MLENVSIIIPFQTDNGPRAEAFKWIKQYYERVMPGAELCVGIIDDPVVNKSKAVNTAAKKATRDIFVIADADVVYGPELIVEAIKELNHSPWVIPFTEIYDIEKEGTKQLITTIPSWPMGINAKKFTKANWLYKGFAGKLIVIRKEHFEAVGGFDERFLGWGGEDDAFSLSVETLCGPATKVNGAIYHVWHPASNYRTNPYGNSNSKLLDRYKRANGNKEKMRELIAERKKTIAEINRMNAKILSRSQNQYMKAPKSGICFAILAHEKKELIKELVENVRYFCPNSTIVLYNGGYDWRLCEGLGVPVCPSSRKLHYGHTAVYFLETMEWLEELGVKYDYFINIDSDALFIGKGYEEYIKAEMKDTDYMGVDFRIPGSQWSIGKELQKDVKRWSRFFKVKPLYGTFNVAQVISRPIVKALLAPERKEQLKQALIETSSWGMDEIVYVNMAKELGFRLKKYSNPLDAMMIRYRPYYTLDEMVYHLSNNKGYLCHPIIRDMADPAREMIRLYYNRKLTESYKSRKYPWYEDNPDNYAVSFPVKGKSGQLELITRSGTSLVHYRQGQNGKWNKIETFASGAVGIPIIYETQNGNIAIVCKMENGNVYIWYLDENGITPGVIFLPPIGGTGDPGDASAGSFSSFPLE